MNEEVLVTFIADLARYNAEVRESRAETEKLADDARRAGAAITDTNGRLRDARGRFVGAGGAARDYAGSQAVAAAASAKLGTSVDGLTSSLTAAAAAWLSIQGAQAAADVAGNAARFEDSARIYAKAGGDLQSLRLATQGMVSDFELVKKANFAQTLGITGATFEKLSQVALASSKVMGLSMEDAYQRIIFGAGKMEIEILEEAGILARVGVATKKYAEETGQTVKQLDEFERRHAFVNEVLRQGEKLIIKAEAAGAKSGDTYARFGATLNNTALTIGNALRPAVEAVIPVLSDMALLLDRISGKDTRTAEEKLADKVKPLAQEAARLREIISGRGVASTVSIDDIIAGDEAMKAARAEDITGRRRLLTAEELNRLRTRAAHLEEEVQKQVMAGKAALEAVAPPAKRVETNIKGAAKGARDLKAALDDVIEMDMSFEDQLFGFDVEAATLAHNEKAAAAREQDLERKQILWMAEFEAHDEAQKLLEAAEQESLARRGQAHDDFLRERAAREQAMAQQLGGTIIALATLTGEAFVNILAGREHAERQILKGLLDIVGSELIAKGGMFALEGAARLLGRDPAGAGQMAIGGAMVAGGAALKAGGSLILGAGASAGGGGAAVSTRSLAPSTSSGAGGFSGAPVAVPARVESHYHFHGPTFDYNGSARAVHELANHAQTELLAGRSRR